MLRMFVHRTRPDLHLERPSVVTAHHRVQRLVAVRLRPGDVIVELAVDGAKAVVHPRQRRVAGFDVVDDDSQRAHIEHMCEIQALALHLLPDAVQMLRPALDVGTQADLEQALREQRAGGSDAGLALRALLVEQAGDAPVLLRPQEAESQVLHLPLDLPDAQPVGQRREDLQRLVGEVARARGLARGKPAQRLQSGRQAQQHHAQVARKRQQHLPDALGLLRPVLGADVRGARRTLDLHQLARVRDEAGVRGPEGLGNDVLRALQVVARIHEVSGRTHRGRRADRLQHGCHTVRMTERVLTGVQHLAVEQRLGEGARAGERRGAVHAGQQRFLAGQLDDGRGSSGGGVASARRRGLHGASRNSRTTCRCSGCTNIGAWPTPANSTSRARGPRCVIATAVSCDSRSDSAPRSSSVSQRSWS